MVAALAAAGFFLAGLAKGIVNIVLIVLCALAGAAIVLGFIDLFQLTLGWLEWVFALLGGLAGWIVYSRFHEGAMVILAGVIGGLLVTRGLTIWMPALQGWLGTVLAIVLAGGGIAYQSGYLAKRQAAQQAQAEAAAAAAVQAPVDGQGTPTTPPSSGG
jgi:hypothetical protein